MHQHYGKSAQLDLEERDHPKRTKFQTEVGELATRCFFNGNFGRVYTNLVSRPTGRRSWSKSIQLEDGCHPRLLGKVYRASKKRQPNCNRCIWILVDSRWHAWLGQDADLDDNN